MARLQEYKEPEAKVRSTANYYYLQCCQFVDLMQENRFFETGTTSSQNNKSMHRCPSNFMHCTISAGFCLMPSTQACHQLLGIPIITYANIVVASNAICHGLVITAATCQFSLSASLLHHCYMHAGSHPAKANCI